MKLQARDVKAPTLPSVGEESRKFATNVEEILGFRRPIEAIENPLGSFDTILAKNGVRVFDEGDVEAHMLQIMRDSERSHSHFQWRWNRMEEFLFPKLMIAEKHHPKAMRFGEVSYSNVKMPEPEVEKKKNWFGGTSQIQARPQQPIKLPASLCALSEQLLEAYRDRFDERLAGAKVYDFTSAWRLLKANYHVDPREAQRLCEHLRDSARNAVALKWETVPMREYPADIPARTLQLAMDIKDCDESVEFFIVYTTPSRQFQFDKRIGVGFGEFALGELAEAVERRLPVNDPFLKAVRKGEERWADVWDETEFQKRLD